MSVLEMRARLEHHIDRLPVLPTVVARLMVLDREDDSFFDEVLELLEADPPFAARILTAANAAASSPRDPVASIRAALVRLGSQGAARAIMDAGVSKVFIPRSDWEKSLWLHALHIGGAMRAMANEDSTGIVDPDVAYMAGLLHDVGRLVMFRPPPRSCTRSMRGRSTHRGRWSRSSRASVASPMPTSGPEPAGTGACPMCWSKPCDAITSRQPSRSMWSKRWWPWSASPTSPSSPRPSPTLRPGTTRRSRRCSCPASRPTWPTSTPPTSVG